MAINIAENYILKEMNSHVETEKTCYFRSSQ